jgi:hypothetical protein
MTTLVATLYLLQKLEKCCIFASEIKRKKNTKV